MTVIECQILATNAKVIETDEHHRLDKSLQPCPVKYERVTHPETFCAHVSTCCRGCVSGAPTIDS